MKNAMESLPPSESPTSRETLLNRMTTSRTFIKWLLSTGVGGVLLAVLYPVSRYVIPPKVTEAGVSAVTLPFKATDVAPNTGRIFKFGNQPGILIRTAAGEFRAFSARCTHLDCIVQYRSDLTQIWCACHNGHYDLTGRNVSGPPPRPLTAFDVKQRGDQLVVSVRS